MMSGQTCESMDWLAYLSNQLSPEEHSRMQEHLHSCTACQAELKDIEQLFDHLSIHLELIDPPVSLKERVMSSIQAESIEEVENYKQEREAKGQPFSRLESFHPGYQRRRPFWIGLGYAILFFLCGGLGLQLNHEHKLLTQLQQQMQDTPAMLSMHATSYDKEGQGEVILIPKGNSLRVIVVVNHLKPTVGSQVYHIWFWHHGTRSSAGVMTVNAEGKGTFVQTFPISFHEIDGIGITLEPNPNTTHPVGPKVLGVSHV
ncbi:hypothetical protein FY534_10810 [Alicyclobacillus sp. TC]|nr:hypothetical protein FY534_10810 [Alicyclobacillus sp. TC]